MGLRTMVNDAPTAGKSAEAGSGVSDTCQVMPSSKAQRAATNWSKPSRSMSIAAPRKSGLRDLAFAS